MQFLKNISLQQLLNDAVQTFLKFPFALLSALTGTIAAITLIEIEAKNFDENEWLIKLIIVSSAGLILFFTLELLARRLNFSLKARALAWLGGLAFLSVYYYFIQPELRYMIRHLALVLALHLAASYIMFLNKREENAFWQFNKAMFLRILTAVLYTTVLYLGLVIAIVALEQLFNLDVPDKIYPELWVFMVGMFNTWFFLAGVPTNVAELEETHTYPKGLKVFTQFVLLPLVTIYLVILYAYMAKILLQWEWPEGWVSVLVLCFSIVGILSLLLIHPIRNLTGNRWMHTFSKWFYRALFPLAFLLVLVIWRRVSEYGITEARYVVIALAVWLVATVLYFVLSKQRNIKFIPFTLSIIALLAVFGPVNMFRVSEWSQVSRLRHLLEQNGLLVSDKVQPASQKLKQETAAQISSIVDYLAEHHGFEAMEGWFDAKVAITLDSIKTGAESKWTIRETSRNEILDQMGLDYTSESGIKSTQYFHYSLDKYDDKGEVFQIDGYSYMAELWLRTDNKNQDLKLGNLPLVVSLENNVLHLAFEEETLRLNLEPITRKLRKGTIGYRTRSEMTFTLAGDKKRARVTFRELSGKEENKEVEVNALELLLFISEL
ncbi:DUF4153 domain-containing protein [Pontibacter burrus]|uniref:DUF4153 domain-containing protein n=1 Tax=Pontibacter burrus TaxID=2704466 RepID=A0A6B3LSD4_9BACT|nr:DUF4153 domain-containing protein [Pontibacter burrus]NEM99742.1 DUF4153 domain-containing protein [Pontibacter burrus]